MYRVFGLYLVWICREILGFTLALLSLDTFRQQPLRPEAAIRSIAYGKAPVAAVAAPFSQPPLHPQGVGDCVTPRSLFPASNRALESARMDTQEVQAKLLALLGALPLHDRSELHALLYAVYARQHSFCLRFEEMATSTALQQLVLAVRLYECNGLQLSGHAAWLLCTPCEHASEEALESIANEQTMVVLLRVGLAQAMIYSYCCRVLTIITTHYANTPQLLTS